MPNGTTWIGMKCVKLSEISQTEKQKYCFLNFYIIYKNKAKQRNKQDKNKITGTGNKCSRSATMRSHMQVSTGQGKKMLS